MNPMSHTTSKIGIVVLHLPTTQKTRVRFSYLAPKRVSRTTNLLRGHLTVTLAIRGDIGERVVKVHDGVFAANDV